MLGTDETSVSHQVTEVVPREMRDVASRNAHGEVVPECRASLDENRDESVRNGLSLKQLIAFDYLF